MRIHIIDDLDGPEVKQSTDYHYQQIVVINNLLNASSTQASINTLHACLLIIC